MTPPCCSPSTCATAATSRWKPGVHEITGRIADVFGIRGRGVVAPGNAGDLVVFALDELGYQPDSFVHDLPGGGPASPARRAASARPSSTASSPRRAASPPAPAPPALWAEGGIRRFRRTTAEISGKGCSGRFRTLVSNMCSNPMSLPTRIRCRRLRAQLDVLARRRTGRGGRRGRCRSWWWSSRGWWSERRPSCCGWWVSGTRPGRGSSRVRRAPASWLAARIPRTRPDAVGLVRDARLVRRHGTDCEGTRRRCDHRESRGDHEPCGTRSRCEFRRG